MPSLDTNILIRFLVQDDAGQLAVARRLIRKSVADQQTLYIPLSVSLELEWVLRTSFGFDKREVTETLSSLLQSSELTFESEEALEIAMEHYRGSKADYSDCVHVALAARAGHAPLWTFDKAASRVTGARLLA